MYHFTEGGSLLEKQSAVSPPFEGILELKGYTVHARFKAKKQKKIEQGLEIVCQKWVLGSPACCFLFCGKMCCNFYFNCRNYFLICISKEKLVGAHFMQV